MEKIKNFIRTKTFIDIMIIIAVMAFMTAISGFILDYFLADRGREFLFPQEILNGLAPFKDIVMIYFPLSYYINAFVYKLFGVSFNSLIIFQACFCTFFMVIYYLTAKEFIGRKLSILLTLYIILSCIFCMMDIFSYVTPYSYARANGIIGSFCCLFFLLKLYKTDNITYGYLAAIATSYAMSNKVEYLTTAVLLFAGLLLYKKLKPVQYINIILITMIFPILTFSLLFSSGVSIADIMSAIDFAVKFSSTEAMQYFLAMSGTTPFLPIIFYPFYILKGFAPLFFLFCASLLYYFLDEKYNNKFILPATAIMTIAVCVAMKHTESYFIQLPLFIIILSIIFFKKIIKNKTSFLLLIATLILIQRQIFQNTLLGQGSYIFPILALCLIIYIREYIFSNFDKSKIDKFITFFLIVLVGTYAFMQTFGRMPVRYPLVTDKGTIYMSEDRALAHKKTIDYIEKNTPKDAKVLVLPEGMLYNYITGRKVNMLCPMMDRLYHDAYGEQKALELVKNSDNDYIILAYEFDLFNFGFEYLYEPNASAVSKYLYENYTKMQQEYGADEISYIAVYKKNQ